MSLDEYQRKRHFQATPEPPPKVEKRSRHRFVVQKHRATRLHYDFRLEMEGVLKSWAMPKGPSLDPADKRLAMQVEDHPVSYFDFEGIIPAGNYGAGTVMVWDVGTWQPLSPIPVNGKYVPGTDAEASAMLAKGDLKFRLNGKRLKGDFALVHIRSRRPGSKGNEWLLIKKHDEHEIAGYDIEQYDTSVLTKRTMAGIAGDQDSAEWQSRPATRGKLKAPWLAEALAKLDQKNKKRKRTTETTNEEKGELRATLRTTSKISAETPARNKAKTSPPLLSVASAVEPSSPAYSAISAHKSLPGAVMAPMPKTIHPMLAEPAEKPFDNPDWLFEIKWDGYRAVAFLADGKLRLVSRSQNDLTAQYPELHDLPKDVKADVAILDGEVVALDAEGRSSFSLMQQRSGIRRGRRRVASRSDIPVLYYAFDLLYLDGYDLCRVPLEQRKQTLAERIMPSSILRYSDHHAGQGVALFEAAKQKGLEGILAKRRASLYEQRRSREWLKIKITRRLECVIGGYTEPEGSRDYFGSVVLGLYDKNGRLIHVGQAGSGFDQRTLADVWKRLRKLETKKNPFSGEVEALRQVHWVKPELVAEIKFSEWTHETEESGPKLRAPVFLGLREDKDAKECGLEQAGA